MGFWQDGKWYGERKSQRADYHDYSSTAWYLVTLVTKKREVFFEIPVLRQIAEQTWHALPERFPKITLDAFVIMPDHIHLIVHLKEDEKRTTLGNVIGAYKSLVIHNWLAYIKSIGSQGNAYTAQIWQRDYNDCIIHEQQHLDHARLYVLDNPAKAMRKEHTSKWLDKHQSSKL